MEKNNQSAPCSAPRNSYSTTECRARTRTRGSSRSCAVCMGAVQCTTGLWTGLCPQSITTYRIIFFLPSASPFALRLPPVLHPSAPSPHPPHHLMHPAWRHATATLLLGSRALFPKLRDTTQRSGTLCLQDARPRHSECLGDSEAARIRQSQFCIVNLPQGLATPEVGQEWE